MKEIFENTEVISNSDESIQDYIINSDEVRPGDIELRSNSDESYEDIENTFNNKAWYILPVILKNKVLTDKSNINNIEVTDLNDMMLVKVLYNTNFSANSIAKKEEQYYNDFVTNKANVVSYIVPKDKEYLCRVIAKNGYSALNKHLLKEYFLD